MKLLSDAEKKTAKKKKPLAWQEELASQVSTAAARNMTLVSAESAAAPVRGGAAALSP